MTFCFLTSIVTSLTMCMTSSCICKVYSSILHCLPGINCVFPALVLCLFVDAFVTYTVLLFCLFLYNLYILVFTTKIGFNSCEGKKFKASQTFKHYMFGGSSYTVNCIDKTLFSLHFYLNLLCHSFFSHLEQLHITHLLTIFILTDIHALTLYPEWRLDPNVMILLKNLP